MNTSLDATLRALNACGCCEGLTLETPVELANQPGLSAIAYHVGTHAQFKRSMLTLLSRSAQDFPVLNNLRTREDDDFSIALLDGWATIADILTFYQERIANESYLRTATERISLLQLARLIGYELRPGVAASAYLAFNLEDATGSPGYATIDIGTKVQSLPGPGQVPQIFETVEKLAARAAWNKLQPRRTAVIHPQAGDTQIYLKGVTTGLKEGDSVLLVGSDRESKVNSSRWDFRIVKQIKTDADNSRTVVTLDHALGKGNTPPDPQAKVYALRKHAALFGYNAPDPRTLPDRVAENYQDQLTGLDNKHHTTKNSEWNFKAGLNNPINLDTVYQTITPTATGRDSWLVLADHTYRKLYLIQGVSESSPNRYTLTAKTTELTLDTSNYIPNFGAPLRNVVAYAQSELLDLAELPIPTPIQGGNIQLVQPIKGLEGHSIIVSGKAMNASSGDPVISETVVVDKISDDGLNLTLRDGLQRQYDPMTVTIYGNVALSTQGESVPEEVLGSGDASQPYQQFTLRQSPLTYVSAPTASGAASTLTVRVNDIQWHEVPTLYGLGPRERVFITRLDIDGKTRVEFGDGRTGTRLPTGRENIRASYRKGIGSQGMVKAGQLSLLMTRPLGVKDVINPSAATGAMDPETLEDARSYAPLTVLTLDRIVSLQDYEDFARAYSGVAKALATWTWSGQVRGVFVTIAGVDGTALPEGSPIYTNLLTAMHATGDPYVPLQIQTYVPVSFRLAARLKTNPDRDRAQVTAAVEQALRTYFSFDARAFGQPVTESEVIAVMQNVPDVVAVDLYALYRTGDNAILNLGLIAAVPLAGADGTVRAAELLTLDKGPLDDLGVMP